MAGSARGLRLRFGASATNQRALRLFGDRLPRLAGGWMPWLELNRYDPPIPRADDWVRLRPTLAGVCGTDMALLTGHASAILSPFASFPAVLGHEVVGVVEERAAGGWWWIPSSAAWCAGWSPAAAARPGRRGSASERPREASRRAC